MLIIEWCMKEAGENGHQADTRPPQTGRAVASKRYTCKREVSLEAAQNLGEKSEINTSNNGKALFKPQIPIWHSVKRCTVLSCHDGFKAACSKSGCTNAMKKDATISFAVPTTSLLSLQRWWSNSIKLDVFVQALENKFPSMGTSTKRRGKANGNGNRQGQQQAEHMQEAQVQCLCKFPLQGAK